jgi:hypothetical protein
VLLVDPLQLKNLSLLTDKYFFMAVQPIVAPIKLNETSANVSNLQLALAELGNIVDAKERMKQTAGETTLKAVRTIQEQNHLQFDNTVLVDKPTALFITNLLKQKNLLGDTTFTVNGVVEIDSDVSVQGWRVLAFDKDHLAYPPVGSAVINAGRSFQLSYDYAKFDTDGKLKIDLLLQLFDLAGNMVAATLIKSADLQQNQEVKLVVQNQSNAGAITYQVNGKIVSSNSASVGNLKVVIVDKNVGGDVQLVATNTDDSGNYTISFIYYNPAAAVKKSQPDLQAKVFVADNPAAIALIGTSDIHYNATNSETLNIGLPDTVTTLLQSEHDTLQTAINLYYTGKLGDLKEDDTQQDISFLANKTGWDARAITMSALADQFSSSTVDSSGAITIPKPFFYALFRAGLPADQDSLFYTDANTLQNVWNQAIAQNVIPVSSASQIPAVLQKFQEISASKMLMDPPKIGVSTLTDLLAVSNLSDSNIDPNRFASLYTANRTNLPAFWNAVTATFGQDVSDKLQVNGKLGYLTLNYAPLINVLHGLIPGGITDPIQLAQKGYYDSENWKTLIDSNKIQIPTEIEGGDETNYANYLAMQVRLSYPTASIADMIGKRNLVIHESNDVTDEVNRFLTSNLGKFEVGVQVIEQYLKDNPAQNSISPDAVTAMKRLHRGYQLTTSDQALMALMNQKNDLGYKIDSAYKIIQYGKDNFVSTYSEAFGGDDVAGQIYDRAVQIHTAMLSISLSYINARTVPAIGVHSPAKVIDPVPSNTDELVAFSTLESIFGSMDYGVCTDCSSILSPAAYLVNLLQFLYPDSTIWATVLQNWNNNANNPPYPSQLSPFDVLMSRRPDIQYLPLTCDNTNTALPYIDIVNETLEYYVANDLTLNDANILNEDGTTFNAKEYHGHDTNGVASEDLLANPQYVIDAAYQVLKSKYFPLLLPFHQPLELLRRYFNKLNVPLVTLMEQFGNADTWMEEIGLSGTENDILTNSSKVPLWQMYGFPKDTIDADVVQGLSNAKQFALRLGITYDEMFALLMTKFINPDSDLIPKLQKLGVTFHDLQKLNDGSLLVAEFEGEFPQDAEAPDLSIYRPDKDIKKWVQDNYSKIMSLITLAIPVTTWAQGKSYNKGDCVIPSSTSYPTLYFECTKISNSQQGLSGNTTPIWPTTTGSTITDGAGNTQITWTCLDVASTASFENLFFRYSDPAMLNQNIKSTDYIKMLRFIRLYKKLGWTIEQTDAAICALWPVADALDTSDVTKVDDGFNTVVPQLGIIHRIMKLLSLDVKRDLYSVLACWSDIGTHGSNSLYRQMFLNPAILSQDAVFNDNGYGEFLTDINQTILDTGSLQRAIINGSASLGDTLITTINGVSIFTKITNAGADVAAQVVTDINASTSIDPISQLQISQLVIATNALNIITIAIKPGVQVNYFTLSSSVSPGSSITYATLNHEAALRAAFNLTSDEFNLIASSLNYDENTVLNIPNVSAIFRRGLLAKKLKISVKELLLYIQNTGFDPFATQVSTGESMLQLIELIELLQIMQDRSFSSAAVLYLIWNHDLSGKSFPDINQITQLAQTLRSDFASIDAQFVVVEDPNGDVARGRVTMVYGQETSNDFFSLLDDTVVISSSYTFPSDDFDSTIAKTHPDLSYDAFLHILSHTGLVDQTIQNALNNIQGVDNAFKRAIDDIFNQSEDIKNSFFNRNQELSQAYKVITEQLDQSTVLQVKNFANPTPQLDASITNVDNNIHYDDTAKTLSYNGILTPTARDILKNIQGVTADFQAATDALFSQSQSIRGEAVLENLDPTLALDRKRQQALQRLADSASIDLNSAHILLANDQRPPIHADDKPDMPAINDVLVLGNGGLTVTGNITTPQNNVALIVDYGMGRTFPLPVGGGAFAGNWTGWIQIPDDGFYNLLIETDAPASDVKVQLDNQTIALTNTGIILRNSEPLPLKGGSLLAVNIDASNIQAIFSLKWETPKRPREVVPSQYLYPSTVFETFANTYVRFLKAASLMTGLSVTANELAFFATNDNYKIITGVTAGTNNYDYWLNVLSVQQNQSTSADISKALLKPLQALLNYSRVKADISPNDESLLNVMEEFPPSSVSSDNDLLVVTKWNYIFYNDLFSYFKPLGLNDFDLFTRIYDAFEIVQRTGISPRSLIQANTNDPSGDIVRKVQASLRALYDPDSWRTLIKPINDEMRSLQRDALVAYILHQMSLHPESQYIDTTDKLFEYFLMDVQMDPCMETSRIRHALSSVQLFLDRCILGLETYVNPSVFGDEKLKQWEWMKRYRVWEANRKVFLWPENWAEPELRDDQSSFFKETMSELLQSDITDDTAAVALLNYLNKLEEVAKLEPCGIFHVNEDTANNISAVDHVIARTSGAKRRHYYRKLDSGGWSPWEEIKLDIEDNPVIPVVWNSRLFVFWLKIVKSPVVPTAMQPPDNTESDSNPKLTNATVDAIRQSATKNANTQINVNAILCYSEFYNGKWQATKTSDSNNSISLGSIAHEDFHRDVLQLNPYITPDGLNITINMSPKGYGGLSSNAFLLYNTHSLPVKSNPIEPLYGSFRTFEFPQLASLSNNTSPGIINYSLNDPRDDGSTSPIDRQMLKPKRYIDPRNIIEANQLLLFSFDQDGGGPFYWQNAWEEPFFFEDSQNSFFVTTNQKEVLMWQYNGIGQGIAVSKTSTSSVPYIPPVIVKNLLPDFSIGELSKIGLSSNDISNVVSKALLNTNSRIMQGLATNETIMYGNTVIGIAGTIEEQL